MNESKQQAVQSAAKNKKRYAVGVGKGNQRTRLRGSAHTKKQIQPQQCMVY